MKIAYLGPSQEVLVGGYDAPHRQGEIRDYPDALGRELLQSRRQRFAEAAEAPIHPPGEVAEKPPKAEKKGRR